MDSNLRCKITDFGLTRLSDATETRSNAAFSTNFAAPELFGACDKCGQDECESCSDDEIVNGNTKSTKRTLETDVYSFGRLYYQVIGRDEVSSSDIDALYRSISIMYRSKGLVIFGS